MTSWRNPDPAPRPVGVFDSGVGGLSVLRELLRALPGERFVYFADRAHMPYGERPLAEVAGFCRAITRFFRGRGAKMVVVACNTASAAALRALREENPGLPFVGMEPAVKPAAERTRTGRVGVLATAGTLRGAPYAGVVKRFARGVAVHEQPCTGLADLIEHGAPEAVLRARLGEWLAPLLAAGIDQLALACTHYPLILPLIQEAAGPGVAVIDPAPAVARQAARVLAAANAAPEAPAVAPAPDDADIPASSGAAPAPVALYASADPELVAAAARRYCGLDCPCQLLTL